MGCKVEFIPDALRDFEALDKSLRREAVRKIDTLAENPFLGKPPGNKMGMDLTGFYKLYFARRRYRIVSRLIGEDIEIIEIVGIGMRDKAEIYQLVARRLKKMRKRG